MEAQIIGRYLVLNTHGYGSDIRIANVRIVVIARRFDIILIVVLVI